MSKFKYVAMTAAILISAWGTTSASWAGPNDFFGSGPYLPGAVGSIDGNDTPSGSLIGGNSGSSGAPAAQSAPAQGAAPSLGANGLPGGTPTGDNTSDEKRMQKKYKASIAHCKDLINDGEAMMQKSPNKDSAMYKKGKIKKEIGEKHLAELQTSSPFQMDPSLAEEADRRTRKDKKNGKS